jgi:4-amino-4-deoxy-L-arabinose transferase-like glycosyltransferase
MINKKHLTILILIFILALAIRTYHLPEYFISSDTVTLPLFLIDSFPDNGLNSLTSTSNYGMNNPLRLVAYPYSIVKPIYYFILIALFSLIGIPLTEFTFFIPGIIIGALSVFAAYYTVRELYNHEAALLSSIVVMLLPIHVMQSRYVTSPRTLAILIQFIALYYLIKFCEKPHQNAFKVSIFLSLVMLASILFPPFLVLALYIIIAYNKQSLTTFSSIRQYLKNNIITLKFLTIPILTVLFLITIFFAASSVGSSYGSNVTMLGHIFAKQPSYGFYLLPVLSYIFDGIGIFLGIISLFLIPFGLIDFFKFNKRGILLAWAFLYIIPFLFTAPSNVRAYIIYGLVPLAIYGVITLYEMLHGYKLRYITIGIILSLTLLTTFSGTYNVSILPLTDIRQGEGSFLDDMGMKALGYWVRENTPLSATFFFDETNEPPVGKYYFHRKSYGLFDSNTEDTYQFYLIHKDEIDYVIVSKENYPLYRSNLNIIVEFTSSKYTYYVLGKEELDKENIDVQSYNEKFDKKYSNLNSLQNAPLYVSQFAPWM